MTSNPIGSIEEHFSNLVDPRVVGRSDHKLLDIVVIAISGVICGAEGWTDIEQFGQVKEEWLRQFLELPSGIPSHDTFGRVFGRLDAEEFQSSFASWVQAVFDITNGQVIAIDGKTARRSHDRVIGKDAIHMVNCSAGGFLDTAIREYDSCGGQKSWRRNDASLVQSSN